MSGNIVVLGSLNMDLVLTAHRIPKEGETVHGEAMDYLPGGKGANQAVGCARLGAAVLMIGAVGRDAFGRMLIESLAANGVRTDGVATCDSERTGTAVIMRTQANNRIIVISGANGELGAEHLSPFEEELKRSDVLLTQLEIPLETVEYGVKLARANGVKTILNPAPAKPLPDSLLQSVDYLTPNETEFELLCGQPFEDDRQLESLMKDWVKSYPHQLIVTRGEKGCSYIQGGVMKTVPSLKVQAVDTTGAGDAFNAALAAAVAGGKPVDEAVRFAVTASGLSVTKFGAQAGMPTLEEVLAVGANGGMDANG